MDDLTRDTASKPALPATLRAHWALRGISRQHRPRARLSRYGTGVTTDPDRGIWTALTAAAAAAAAGAAAERLHDAHEEEGEGGEARRVRYSEIGIQIGSGRLSG